jgi:hypothetical protein
MSLKISFVLTGLIINSMISTLWARQSLFSPAGSSEKPGQPNEFTESEQSAFTFLKHPMFYFPDSVVSEIEKPKRSIGKAALFSAAIPGAGELYNKSFLKGLAFLGIEVGAWVVYGVYTKRGNEKEDEFERFADLHWKESEYWRSLADDSNGKCSEDNLSCLKEYERENFSHFLPETKNQTYYENIGKYDQFNAGWDDSKSGQARQRDSERREIYTRMRRDANDQFKTATLGATVVLFNHILSALDAAWTTYRFNQRQMKASMGMEMQRYDQELVPALSLTMKW